MVKLNFIQLDPRTPKDQQPSYDLGIEVTITDMKNDVDHHGEKSDLPPAIQQVMDKIGARELSSMLQGKDVFNVATVRPDADSVGSMAVLKLKVEGRTIDKQLVRIIAILDMYGPMQLKKEIEGDPELDTYQKITNAINYVVTDFKKSLDEKVAFVQYCLDGSVDQNVLDEFWAKKTQEDEKIRSGAIIEEVIPGKLLLIQSKERGAMMLGYELASTVIAVNPEMPVMEKGEGNRFVPTGETYVKYTIAKNTEAIKTDIEAINKELNELEEGRGGRGTIIGSPQNVNSNLTSEQVIDIVKKYVK